MLRMLRPMEGATVQPVSEAEVRHEANIAALPSEVCFAICQHLEWKDLLFLEVASKATRSMVTQEPLTWAFQVLKSFPRERLPKPVMKCLASPLCGSINWREVFMELRYIKPACAFEQQALPGWEPPARLNARLDSCPGSDYEEVLVVGKRSSFIAKFEALRPGKYVLMCRIKVAPGRKAYVSYSTKFSRKAGSSTEGEGSFGTAPVDRDATAAAPSDARSNPLEQPHRNLRFHEWLTASQAEGEASAASTCGQDDERQPQPHMRQLWKKLKPSPQFLLGSYSSSWRQVGHSFSPTISSLFCGTRPRAQQPAGGAGAEEQQHEEGSSHHSQGRARVMELTQPTPASPAAAPLLPPNPNEWHIIPLGHVTIRAACRSTNIQMVALSTSLSRQVDENVTGASSIFIDYVCLRPADDAVVNMLPSGRVFSLPLARSLGSKANEVAKLFKMGHSKSKVPTPSALSLL